MFFIHKFRKREYFFQMSDVGDGSRVYHYIFIHMKCTIYITFCKSFYDWQRCPLTSNECVLLHFGGEEVRKLNECVNKTKLNEILHCLLHYLCVINRPFHKQANKPLSINITFLKILKMFYFILFNMRNYIHILKNAVFQNFETDQFLATLKTTKIIDFRQLFCIF